MKIQSVLVVILVLVAAMFVSTMFMSQLESSQNAVQGRNIGWEYGQLVVEGQQVLWTVGGPNTPIVSSFSASRCFASEARAAETPSSAVST